MAKLDIAETVFFSQVFQQMVKSAETVDPRVGRKNIPALPSRSRPSLSQVAPHTLALSNL